MSALTTACSAGSWRCGQCARQIPPKMIQPVRKSAVGNPDTRGPLGQAQGYTVISDAAIATRHTHLFRSRGPSAIPRFIIAIIINAVDGMAAAWPPTHIRSKCHERFIPPLADLNASPAIVPIVHDLRIPAALLHGPPYPIPVVLAHSMDRQCFRPKFVGEAPATAGSAAAQYRALDDSLPPALAATEPHRPSFPRRPDAIKRPRQNREPTKGSAAEIDKCWHHHTSASLRSAASLARDARRGWPPGSRHAHPNTKGALVHA